MSYASIHALARWCMSMSKNSPILHCECAT
jgi:hypothetical protein